MDDNSADIDGVSGRCTHQGGKEQKEKKLNKNSVARKNSFPMKCGF
jgi:hypothetical protein